MKEIVRRIKIFEGFSKEPYICPAGKWTIGYGYNYQDRGFSVDNITKILRFGFTEEFASELVKRDVAECMYQLEKTLPLFETLSEPRRAVLVDMAYQLGLNGLLQFKRMLEALKAEDYETASNEMKNSKWYTQSGRRSVINTEQMKTGQWQEV